MTRPLLLFYCHLTARQTDSEKLPKDPLSQEVEVHNFNPNLWDPRVQLLTSSPGSLPSAFQGLGSLRAGAASVSAQVSSRAQCKAQSLVDI